MSAIPWTQRGMGRLEPPDRQLLEDFQRATFGEHARQLDPAHHHWTFEDVAFPDPEGIQFWVCKRKEAIVGQQAGIPFRLKAGGVTLRAAWAIDLMVAPDWRLRGVGPALTETHAASNDVTVALAPSEAAFKAYKRGGWIDLGSIPTYVRVIDPVPCLAAMGKGKAAHRIAAALARPLVTAATAGAAAAAWLAGARLQEISRFDERADRLWAAARLAGRLMTERTAGFLQWRFDRSPDARHFTRHYVVKDGKVMGYVVLRHDRWRGVPVTVVLDYLARPGWTAATFALTVEQARRQGQAALLCRTRHAGIGRPLSAQGFVCFPNGVTMPTRMMARLGPDAQRHEALVSDPDAWTITAADSDLGFTPLR